MILYLTMAAVGGNLLGAPVWVLAWEHRARPITLAKRSKRIAQTRVGHRVPLAAPHTGRHTPRGGTPIPTPAQIAERTAAA